ncbi:HECD4 ligase, partial [Polypterus senegalus]
ELQTSILSLATKILVGCDEVLETLQQVTTALINSDISDRENREVIQPDVMEEVIVSCVIKHLTLIDALQSLINFQYREEHAEEYDLLCKIMAETFKKINAMERQLQSVAELEQKWQNEVEEAQQGKLENNAPFFNDYHFFEKSSTTLLKTKSLVKSLMNRTELLLHVTISPQSRSVSGTPADTPACKSVSEAKPMSHNVKQPVFLRSMSAPSDLEMIANEDLEFNRGTQRRRHHATSHRSSSFTLLQSLTIEDCRDKPTYSVLLGQLFAFIGTNPDQAVSWGLSFSGEKQIHIYIICIRIS